MFGFQYKHQHFYHGDGEQCIMWDEMYSLMKGGELGAQIICFWELLSLIFIFFINYHVVDTCQCRMMMKYCEDHTILDIAYLDPTMITEALVMKKLEEMENYIVNFFLKHQNK
jgi:hypothetical protein